MKSNQMLVQFATLISAFGITKNVLRLFFEIAWRNKARGN